MNDFNNNNNNKKNVFGQVRFKKKKKKNVNFLSFVCFVNLIAKKEIKKKKKLIFIA